MTKCGQLQAHAAGAGPIYSGQFKRGPSLCLAGANVAFTLITLLACAMQSSIFSHLFGNCSYPWTLRIFPYRAYSCCLCFCFCSCILLPRCLSQNLRFRISQLHRSSKSFIPASLIHHFLYNSLFCGNWIYNEIHVR